MDTLKERAGDFKEKFAENPVATLTAALTWLDLFVARIISIIDARALDLNFSLIEKRLNLSVLATSLLFTAATTALFADPFEEPTPELLQKISEDFVAAGNKYASKGLTPGTFSSNEIKRAQALLDATNGNLTSTEWESNYLMTYYNNMGTNLIQAFSLLMAATLFTIVTYLAVALLYTSGPRPRRFPLNVFYYFHAYTFFYSMYLFVYGTVLLTTFARYRFIFTYSSTNSQYERMRIQDYMDPYTGSGNYTDLSQIGLLISVILLMIFGTVGSNFVKVVVDVFYDRTDGRAWFVGYDPEVHRYETVEDEDKAASKSAQVSASSFRADQV